MLTAYTLYTYKKSCGYTDKLHPIAVAFIPGSFAQRLSPSVGLTRAPVRIPPREAHLPGRPADTFLLSVTFRGGGRPDWPADTFPSRGAPGRMGGGCWWRTAPGSSVLFPWPRISPAPFLSAWLTGIRLFLLFFSCWIVIGFHCYMKNSSNPC